MKIRLNESDSKIVKDNDTYRLIDNTELNNLIVSKTILHPRMCTTGHSHPGQEEIYQFTSGHGRMQLDNKKFDIHPNDIVLIPDGVFHKVWNASTTEDLVFICVFNGKRNH